MMMKFVLIYNVCILYDDDDEEVRRVYKTPGDPCRCTRQHSQRSGLPLPSPIRYTYSVQHYYKILQIRVNNCYDNCMIFKL